MPMSRASRCSRRWARRRRGTSGSTAAPLYDPAANYKRVRRPIQRFRRRWRAGAGRDAAPRDAGAGRHGHAPARSDARHAGRQDPAVDDRRRVDQPAVRAGMVDGIMRWGISAPSRRWRRSCPRSNGSSPRKASGHAGAPPRAVPPRPRRSRARRREDDEVLELSEPIAAKPRPSRSRPTPVPRRPALPRRRRRRQPPPPSRSSRRRPPRQPRRARRADAADGQARAAAATARWKGWCARCCARCCATGSTRTCRSWSSRWSQREIKRITGGGLSLHRRVPGSRVEPFATPPVRLNVALLL